MGHAIWKGAVSFGLVNIPVSLQSAVREHQHDFRLLEEGTLCPVKYERVCKKSRKTVPWKNIVKGYEYEKDKFVVLTDEDFNNAALATSKAFEIEDFVPEEQIDPRYFEKPYYLVPEEGADRVYALLREAMNQSGTVGVGRITMHNRQHLAAIKPLGSALELNIMRFADEVVEEDEYEFPKEAKPKTQEMKAALKLIESLSSDFDPSKYKDQYKENLDHIIASKMKGKKVNLAEAPEPQPTGIIDLMQRLQESLKNDTKARKPTRKKAATTRRKRA